MAVCSKYTNQVTIEASEIFFGKEELSCIEPDNTLLGGESFTIYNHLGGFQIWFTVGGTGSAPTPANGETLIEVTLPASYTLKQLSDELKTAVDADFYFYDPKEDHSQLLLESFDVGEVDAPIADVDTGWMVHTIVKGFDTNLGKTAEGISVTFDPSTVEVTADQSGPLNLGAIMQTVGSNLSMGLQELSVERLRRLIAEGYGDSFTPSGGTELIGYGTSKIGVGTLELAGRLRLHPIRMGADRSEDFNYWKTLPNITETNYSGTEKRVLTVDFTAINDEFKPKEISVCAFGDGSQKLA